MVSEISFFNNEVCEHDADTNSAVRQAMNVSEIATNTMIQEKKNMAKKKKMKKYVRPKP